MPARGPACGAWALAAIIASALPLAGQNTPSGWQRFERILWMHRGPERTPALFAAIRAMGYTAISVSGREDPAIPGKHGLRFYRDQAVGKGVLELRDETFAKVRDAYRGDRRRTLLVRPTLLGTKAAAAACERELERRLDPALPHGPIAISLGDEISVTRHGNPLDLCFAPESLRELRVFLLARHGNLARLNAAWGTQFTEVEQVVPMTADEIRAREHVGHKLPGNLRPWAEHREFMDRRLAKTVAEVTRSVALRDADLPCGLTGLQTPSAYGGHDYRQLLPHCSFYEAYDIGGSRALAMSLARPRARQIATLFAPKNGEPPRITRARLADCIAHGMAGVVVWSAEGVFGDGVRATDFGRSLRTAFEALAGPMQAFAGARIDHDPIWIVESMPSVRAHWMLDSSRDGDTWIRRLSSYEARHSTSQAARLSWQQLFEDLGFQPRFVDDRDLSVALLRGGPRLLVLPATIAMSDATARAIRVWVASGGVLVADHTPAFYDEHLVLREAPALDELFGVTGRRVQERFVLVRGGKPDDKARLPSGAAAAEGRLDAELAEPAGKFNVQLERSIGRGKAIYLNLAVCEYASVRLTPGRIATAVDLRRRVRRALDDARLAPAVTVSGRGLPTCIERALLRGRGGRALLALRFNALGDPGLMKELGRRGRRKSTVRMPRDAELIDLVTGKSVPGVAPSSGSRGPSRREFEIELDPWTGAFFEVRWR